MDLKTVLGSIEKRFGSEAIVTKVQMVERVSSGSYKIDSALGGGYPKGRIIEFIGWESSGKTTIALSLAAEIQKLGKAVGYIDAENALDSEYAEKLGVNMSIGEGQNFFLAQPNNAEEALEIVREFSKTSEIGLIVIDSIPSLVPQTTLDGEAGDAKMAVLARLMSQQLPILASQAKLNDVIIVFINQWREKIGVMFGSPLTTPGGNALKFYASQRLEIARGEVKNDADGDAKANDITIKVIKNKVAPPFRKVKTRILYGVGIDIMSEMLDLSVEFGIVDKKGGGWYFYGDVKLGQGDEQAFSTFMDNIELMEEIRDKVLEQINKGTKIQSFRKEAKKVEPLKPSTDFVKPEPAKQVKSEPAKPTKTVGKPGPKPGTKPVAKTTTKK